MRKMQEVLNVVADNLTPAMVAGNAALALALIPTQYLVDVGKKKIECFLNEVLPHHPEEVFYEAFLKTLEEHKKHHDHTAGNLVNKLIRQLKKDKSRFYNCERDVIGSSSSLLSVYFGKDIFHDIVYGDMKDMFGKISVRVVSYSIDLFEKLCFV